MRRMAMASLAILISYTLSSSSAAQSLFELPDGRLVEGRMRGEPPEVEILTPFGLIQSAGPVGEVSTEEEQRLQTSLGTQIADLPSPDFLAGRAAIARWALERGLLSACREQLTAILERDLDHRRAHALIAEIASTFAVHPREKGTRGRDRRAFVRFLCEEYAARGWVEALIALSKLEGTERALAFREALRVRDHESPGSRYLAARALASHRHRPTRIKPLYRRALTDPVPEVRREAVRSLAVTRDPVFVRLFAKNFASPRAAVRRNAAEALAEFGDARAAVPLIKLLEAGGGTVRSNIVVSTQTAYVKDFDVEVAQGAVIADPVIDVVQAGAVLDVGIVGISVVRRTAAAALARLTGESFGTDVAAWRRWARERAKQESD